METKKCRTCLEVKGLDEFYFRRDNQKPAGECKLCRKAKSHARHWANPQRHAVLVKIRYDAYGRYARYGLTKEQYDRIFEQQGSRCALCGATESNGKAKKWHIDHEPTGADPRHVNKRCDADSVRGILCHRCNVAMGHYEALEQRVGHDRIDEYRRQRVDV